jgi:hypothetical protein
MKWDGTIHPWEGKVRFPDAVCEHHEVQFVYVFSIVLFIVIATAGNMDLVYKTYGCFSDGMAIVDAFSDAKFRKSRDFHGIPILRR